MTVARLFVHDDDTLTEALIDFAYQAGQRFGYSATKRYFYSTTVPQLKDRQYTIVVMHRKGERPDMTAVFDQIVKEYWTDVPECGRWTREAFRQEYGI